ncbi:MULTISPECIES: siderophore-interacting protein [Streptomyces]|uniref:Siderophore-interacting protein n=3 Tax=Streptomyces TaxID=1883 RepID=A0A8H9HDY3_9ACTN|nr:MULTISPECIES: siderophore-interacting protein [Streptomyces]MDQ0292655.1 NADPH-dependent ferric siderophore reductase [Streptomyces sp. DSM 41037]SUP60089.1 MxcB [Streptomyces griseus]GFH68496.1 siderophore-interacting protein [Streptomyces rutgersensis]GFH73699.1 siderophore-interacting protein [Streptomyces diastaticus subsp. diastaticus]GFH79130.1 siderophore-interacting protein [Streptomyces gougerotii]
MTTENHRHPHTHVRRGGPEDPTADRSDPGPKVAEHHRNGTGPVRIPYPIGVRTLEVLARTWINPRMVRLTLGGPQLDGFHSHQADDHVKLVFPDPDGTLRALVPAPGGMLTWPRPAPLNRVYTVRRYDAAARQLDLDFVVHEGGHASGWAVSVPLGERITVAGPPGAKSFPHTYDHYVFAADATALPAVARWLDECPEDTSVEVVLETEEECEHDYPLADRPGVEVIRLTRAGQSSRLADTVRRLHARPGRTFLFAAGESGDIKPLRAWSQDRCDALFTGYWKRGVAGLED